ncbi:MAG: hypothetical protein ACUZ8I_11705 [Candidatus Scalindua sp.]
MQTYLGKLIYRTIQNWRQEPVFKYLQEVEESQWYSEDRLRELQWERLKALIDYAYKNVPYYMREFNRLLGISSNQINSPNDISILP